MDRLILTDAFKLADAYKKEAEFTNPHSLLFVDRYGEFRTFSDSDVAMKREGVFFVATAHNHLLLNCAPWAPHDAELTGGGIKPGETKQEALSREISEEVGLDISAHGIEALDPKTDSYYMNLYIGDKPGLEEKTPWLRYTQHFFYMDISHMVTKDSLSEPMIGEDSSYGFWQPMAHIQSLPTRIDTQERIQSMRIGHQHIILRTAQPHYRPTSSIPPP